MNRPTTTDRERRRAALAGALARNLGQAPTAADRPSAPPSRRRALLFTGIAFCLATFLLSARATRLSKQPPELDLAHYSPSRQVELVVPPLEVVAAEPRQPRSWPLAVRTIVIDAGHGGESYGTKLPSGLNEKDLVLDIGLRLRDLLTTAGFQTLMTREDDRDISLERRSELANQRGGDLLVSIHVNWLGPNQNRGIETYYADRQGTRRAFPSHSPALAIDSHFPATPTELIDLKLQDSRRLAEAVQRQLVSFLTTLDPEISDRGVKTAPLVVLAHAQMPAILAEVSCLSNEKDATLLQRASYRQYIADALAQGISGFADETSFRTEAGR